MKQKCVDIKKEDLVSMFQGEDAKAAMEMD